MSYPGYSSIFTNNIVTDHRFIPGNLLILLIGLFSLNKIIIIDVLLPFTKQLMPHLSHGCTPSLLSIAVFKAFPLKNSTTFGGCPSPLFFFKTSEIKHQMDFIFISR